MPDTHQLSHVCTHAHTHAHTGGENRLSHSNAASFQPGSEASGFQAEPRLPLHTSRVPVLASRAERQGSRSAVRSWKESPAVLA